MVEQRFPGHLVYIYIFNIYTHIIIQILSYYPIERHYSLIEFNFFLILSQQFKVYSYFVISCKKYKSLSHFIQ